MRHLCNVVGVRNEFTSPKYDLKSDQSANKNSFEAKGKLP